MKNKKHLRDMLIGCVLTVIVFGFFIPVMAESNNHTAQVVYENIKLIVNGQTINTSDQNKKQLNTILIDGTAYIPAQSISSALNLDLSWDNSTKTVTLTSKIGSLSNKITPDETGYIGVEKAKSIALDHANILATNAIFYKTELDYDDGIIEYEIEFYSGNKEYDYSIDPKSGLILSWDHEVEGYNIPSQFNDNKANLSITLDQAKSLAKAKVPNATLISCKLDYDDGKYVYEGELRDGKTEYEFEIDAVSGQFIKWNVEIDD